MFVRRSICHNQAVILVPITFSIRCCKILLDSDILLLLAKPADNVFLLFLCLKPPVKFLSSVLGKSNLQFSGVNIKLTISTNSLTLINTDTQQVGYV